MGTARVLCLPQTETKRGRALRDLTESTRVEAFAKKYPARYFEVGVAEQKHGDIAAGLGVSGKNSVHRIVCHILAGQEWELLHSIVIRDACGF